MKRTFAITLSLTLLLPACWAGQQTVLKDQSAKDSYSLGYEFGDNLRKQEIELDPDIVLAAAREALNGKQAALSAEEMHDALRQLRKKALVLQDRRFRERAAKNLEEGKAFLAANKMKEGVTTLPSGLQYKLLQAGDGPSPKITDTVTIQYRGILINGTEFDSSFDRGEPSTIHVSGVMRGWTEALQLMKVGSKWQLFVPTELAYGERQFGRIPPNSTLIFELELVSIEKPSQSGKDETSGASGVSKKAD